MKGSHVEPWTDRDDRRLRQGRQGVLVVSIPRLVAVLERSDLALVRVELALVIPRVDEAFHLQTARGVVNAGGFGGADRSALSWGIVRQWG